MATELKPLLNLLTQYQDRDRYFEALEQVGEYEREQWSNHPCTQALRFSLEDDLAEILTIWANGGYSTEDSIDGTAQKQAKARGMAQAICDVLESMRELQSGEHLEDE